MKLVYLPIFLFSTLSLHAQSLKWAFNIGVNNHECVGKTIAHDGQGNIYVGGHYGATTDFDPGPGQHLLSNGQLSSLYRDFFVAKYDGEGNLLWAFDSGARWGIVSEIAIDPEGNIVVLGSFEGTGDFDPGEGQASLSSQSPENGNDLFLAKYDPRGNYIWAFALPVGISIISPEPPQAMAVDAAGAIYITGELRRPVDLDPGEGEALFGEADERQCFVAKYNEEGTFQWAFQLDATEGSSGKDIHIDPVGHVLLTGYYGGAMDLDPGEGTSVTPNSEGEEAFLAKYNTLGGFLWGFALASSPNGFFATGNSMTTDAEGNIYLSGQHKAETDFDPGPGEFLLEQPNGFLAKYSDKGHFLWAAELGGREGLNEVNGVAIDNSGNVYITGSFSGLADFDPGAGEALIDAVSFNKIFFASYNAEGGYRWAFAVNSNESGHGESVAIGRDGEVYFTGRFLGTCDFAPGEEAFQLTSRQWGWDCFVGKYGTEALTSTEEIETPPSFSVFPNPAQDHLTLRREAGGGLALLEIIDVRGRLLYTNQLDTAGQQELDISFLEVGTYFLRLRESNSISTRKITKH